jgi:hypothetical protein
MRSEPYAAAHERSRERHDRRVPPATLSGLLRWAHLAYVAETPNLEHAIRAVGDDGDPQMRHPVRAYLAMDPPSERLSHADQDRAWSQPDVWVRVASRTDADGMYRTPLRRAIEAISDPERRGFLRDLVPEALRPSDIATLHGIPDWCQGDVMYRSLAMLWDRYRDQPEPRPTYLDKSDSQKTAEVAA